MMGSLTIRNLDDAVKQALRVKAAQNGHSMEEEAREILRRAVTIAPPKNLAEAIHARFAPLGGLELDLPPRDEMAEVRVFFD
jgi:plasmid stability protein